jgi:hypothetical protein
VHFSALCNFPSNTALTAFQWRKSHGIHIGNFLLCGETPSLPFGCKIIIIIIIIIIIKQVKLHLCEPLRTKLRSLRGNLMSFWAET